MLTKQMMFSKRLTLLVPSRTSWMLRRDDDLEDVLDADETDDVLEDVKLALDDVVDLLLVELRVDFDIELELELASHSG